LVVRAVAAAGVPIWLAELLVTAVAGAAAVVLICLVASWVGGTTVGRRASIAWVVAPPAFVLGLGYSEALFVAAAAGCLLGLLRQRWLTAGLAGCVATATRPVGVALVAAALVAAMPMVMQRRVRPLTAVLLVPAGGVAYLLWIGARTGRADAWLVTEREGWGAQADLGLAMMKVAGYNVLHPGQRPLFLVATLSAAISAGLLALAVRDRLPLPLLVFSAGVLFLAASSGIPTVGSFPRIALTAFPLFIPLATRLGRLSSWTRYSLAAGSVAVMLLAAVLATTTTSYTP
jgi:hypothetical protein